MSLAKPDSQSTRTVRGIRRAGSEVLSVPELADRLRVSETILTGMLETGGFFAGAWKDAAEGWMVPERAVRAFLGRHVEPLFTIAEAAEYLRIHKVTAQNAVAAWLKGDRRGLETVEIDLPGSTSKRVPRITLTELQRHVRTARPA